MKYLFLSIFILLIWNQFLFTKQIKSNEPQRQLDEEEKVKLEAAGLGDAGLNISVDKQNYSTFTPYYTSDNRPIKNQLEYEILLTDQIIPQIKSMKFIDRDQINNKTTLEIKNNFAFQLVLNKYQITLLTLKYNIYLDNCQDQAQNVSIITHTFREVRFFDYYNPSTARSKQILQSLLNEGRPKEAQNESLPLFVSLDPSLTFLSQAIILDRLEKVEANFLSLPYVWYCKDCNPIVGYHQYAYYNWFEVSNKQNEQSGEYFNYNNINIVYAGITENTIFTVYANETGRIEDKNQRVLSHFYCENHLKKSKQFIVNQQNDRSPSNFALSLLKEFISQQQAISSEQNEIMYPCYHKSYNEKFQNMQIIGTGNIKECESLVEKIVLNESLQSDRTKKSSDHHKIAERKWPFEAFQNTDLAEKSIIYIESEILQRAFNLIGQNEDLKITNEILSKSFDQKCNDFISQLGPIPYGERNECLQLLYIKRLFLKSDLISSAKEVILKVKTSTNSHLWMKGLAINNMQLFHKDEKDWFYLTQARIMKNHITSIKSQAAKDKKTSMNATFILVLTLVFVFWLAFIVRFRKMDEDSMNFKKR